jgi:hypothetical protein
MMLISAAVSVEMLRRPMAYGLLTTGVCVDGLQGWFQNDLSLMMMHLYLI